ncbi:hypothetical protein [Rhodococcus globerulus]|uniref:hypothetical protein n=1 Tax=Rhodococcus globerulus TaxID=33008 RepID=UPI001C587C86|nr:hypothetical protein [Rhodococcus globerulus]QXW04031.1 hypothetical protein KYT97_08430 [Rhodococcus globerulus]
MNDRTHWRAKARITAGLRSDTKLLAKSASVPTGLAHATVSLHYQPAANRKRDADNLVPVLKACCDGLVDHGLVADDTPDLMQKLMPLIHPAVKGQPGTLWLEIEWENS